MTRALFGGLPEPLAGPRLGQRRGLTYRGNAGEGRHGWLRLTPAYSLHVVRDILQRTPPTGMVLEPFCGTGTTPLACAELGYACHAFDINPFLVWLAGLKLRPFCAAEVRTFSSAADEVAGQAKRMAQSGLRCWVPPIHQIEKWWDGETLRALAALLSAIRTSGEEASAVGDLLRLAFCRTMIETAEVTFGHQSMSFRRRSRGGTSLLSEPKNVWASFAKGTREILDSLQDPLPPNLCESSLGDARGIAEAVGDRKFGMVITSPPYPNRMSYIRELRPYMYWLGYLEDGRQAGELDWLAIGGTWGCATSLLATWEPDPACAIPFDDFHRIVRAIAGGNPLLAKYVHKYFCDVVRHLRSLAEILVPGALCNYIVGNSKFYDTVLPTQAIYAAILEAEGYVSVDVSELRKRTSKKELFEYVVRAEKPR